MADNASVVRNAVEAFNSGKSDALSKIFGRDLAQNAGESLKTLRGAFPDLQYTLDHVEEEGNQVTFAYTVRGTHKGALGDLKASNREAHWTGWGVATVENGVITNVQTNEDWARAGRLLGVATTPSMTGTWIGSSQGTTVTIVCVQTGTAVTGTATISGISGSFPLNGTNNYPNVSLGGQVFGLNVTYVGPFVNDNQINGTLTVQGFPPTQTPITRQTSGGAAPKGGVVKK